MSRSLILILAAWSLVYGAVALLGHYSLWTNAYDLSVFDYALWATLHGRLGYVPFFEHSLFAHHFMPTLLVLLPIYAVSPSPALLIVLQLAAVLGAAVLLIRLARRLALDPWLMHALVVAFLFSRRPHSAITRVFHIESFEPLLMFGFVLALLNRKLVWYWLLVVLALGCKEDVSLYVGAFGLVLLAQRHTRVVGALTAAVAALWLAGAVAVAVPHFREAEGLPRANPFVEARYGDSDPANAAGGAVDRLISVRSVSKLFTLTSTVGFLCWLSPTWFAVAAPGVALNLAARPDTLQSGLLAHYLWPILPWVFLAAVRGGVRVQEWRPSLARIAAAALILLTIADTPVWRSWSERFEGLDQARLIRQSLVRLPDHATILAMPNLIPHLPHNWRVKAIRGFDAHTSDTDYAVLSIAGDPWPLDRDEVPKLIAAFPRRSDMKEIETGPLHVFTRR